jgi:hypothetical protein
MDNGFGRIRRQQLWATVWDNGKRNCRGDSMKGKVGRSVRKGLQKKKTQEAGIDETIKAKHSNREGGCC